MTDQEELSLTQAAAFFGVNTDTLVDTLVPKYNIPYRKDKRRWFFRRKDLETAKEQMYRRNTET